MGSEMCIRDRFDAVKTAHFGTPAERADPNAANILQAKRRAYRYCVFGETHSGGTSSGISEIGGNDFIVTLGGWSPYGGTDDQKIGTFMHEFGHTLGLYHGGHQVDLNNDARYNFKPNYYSVMNYRWQFPQPWNTPGSWPKNYSVGSLPALNESDLSEPLGFGAPASFPQPGFSVPFNTEPNPVNPVHTVYAILATLTGVDWNNNATIDPYPPPVARDINRRKDSDSHPGDTLTDHNDWMNLALGFRFDDDYADGAHGDTTGSTEMTLQTFNEIAAIPPPIADTYCEGKLHSGGCVAQMAWTGVPSVTSPNPFTVRADLVKPNVSGIVFYGYEANNAPFQGGTLCVGSTLHRTPLSNSGGSGPCGGTIAYEFNARIQAGVDPGLVVGAQVFCQVQFRDAQDPAGFGAGYSNALRFTIQP